MTKEELLRKTTTVNGSISNYIKIDYIRQFFESHICITKGENRHPYADVLHEFAEGKTIQWLASGIEWLDVSKTTEYRIKPPEPVYEYQTYIIWDGQIAIGDMWKTEEEFNANPHGILVKETKRERKQ